MNQDLRRTSCLTQEATGCLCALGIEVMAPELKSPVRVQSTLRELIHIPVMPDAQNIGSAVDTAMSALTQSPRANLHRTLWYFNVNSRSYAAEENSFTGKTLARLEAITVLATCVSSTTSCIHIVRTSPNPIKNGWRCGDGTGSRTGCQSVRIVRAQHVSVILTQSSRIQTGDEA